MKYLKLFNESISENPILNNNEIKNLVINNLTPMFNLLGIKHTCDSGYQEGKGTPIHYYDFYFDFNIAEIPYSILWILTRHLVDAKAKKSKITLMIDLFSENHLTIKLGPKKLAINYMIPSIDPKTIKEAFDEIIKQLIYSFESCTDEVLLKQDGLLSKEKFNAKDILLSFIENNKYESPISIPEFIIKEVELSISKMKNPFKVYQEIQINNKDLYDELKRNNKDKTTIAKDMGDLGFE